MYARKLRYDENFIAPRNRAGSSSIRSADVTESQPVASPALALQGELQARIANKVSASFLQNEEKYSSITSLTIIVSGSILLWSCIIAAIIAIY